ncbi:IPT/TIG domain-containing protein [Pseudoxanthomonas sp. NC8]|nr:IPT/TIG domain-containing protein [Pseudoxanthomonas sp. NC8]
MFDPEFAVGVNYSTGLPEAEDINGTNGGVYTFSHDLSSGVVSITLKIAPAGGSGSITLYSYIGPDDPPDGGPVNTVNTFNVTLAPAVTAISPSAGPTAGGTVVVITGTNFSGATAVRFGASNAGYTVNSATQITATAPAGAAGTVDVTVTTTGGSTSATSAADRYTYVSAPTVTGISPASGSTAGGTTVTITGTNFGSATAVTFGATPATGYTVNSATQITATAPARAAGVVDVRVTNPGGTSATSAADQFTFAVPLPVVSDARISITGASGTGGAYKVGDTVTATWDNTGTGDNSPGITAVTVDFSQFGGGAAVAASNSSGTWTATYTITAGVIDATSRNVSVTATSAAGSTTTADTSNATVDSIPPTVSDGRISISPGSGTGGAYKIGDTVEATWNNTAGGDNNSDTISAVTVNFTQFGGGPAVSASNSSGTWKATYTIVAGAINGVANRNVTVVATDNAGNATATSDTSNATVDNVAPAVSGIVVSGSPSSGDTSMAFTVNFNDPVSNVSTDDFTWPAPARPAAASPACRPVPALRSTSTSPTSAAPARSRSTSTGRPTSPTAPAIRGLPPLPAAAPTPCRCSPRRGRRPSARPPPAMGRRRSPSPRRPAMAARRSSRTPLPPIRAARPAPAQVLPPAVPR